MDEPLRVFVSYRSVDLPWADWITKVLRARGAEVRYQPEFSKSQSFIKQISDGIEWCNRLVIILSSRYFDSDWTAMEWETGLHKELEERRRLLRTIRVESFQVPGPLRLYPHLDLFAIDLDGRAEDALLRCMLDEAAPVAVTYPAGRLRRPLRQVIPHPRLPLFFGRQEELKTIETALAHPAEKRVVALKGMAGVGKTALAVQYCYAHGGGYEHVFWVEGQSLREDLARLAQDLLKNAAAAESEERCAQAIDWLDTHGSWLLVIDGVDGAEQIAAVETILLNGDGHCLVTSQLGHWNRFGQMVTIEPWAVAKGAAFLAQSIGRGGAAPEYEAIAGALGGLPLALEHAASFLRQTRLGAAQYLTQLRGASGEGWNDGRRLAAACELALAALEPRVRALLELLAWLAPEPLPRSALIVALAQGTEAGAPPEEDRTLVYHRALADLEWRSMLSLDEDTVRFHPLVQGVVRRRVAEEARAGQIAEAIDLVTAMIAQEGAGWVPHAVAVLEHARRAEIASEAARNLTVLVAFRFLEIGAPQDAKRFLDAAIEQLGADGNSPADVCAAMIILGQCQVRTGQFAEAVELFQRVLARCAEGSALPPAEHAVAHAGMASALRNLGRFEEAETHYRKAFALTMADTGVDVFTRADFTNNLALFFREQGRFREAEPLFREAEALAEAGRASNPELTAKTVPAIQVNLGLLLRLTGRLDEATRAYEEAMEIWEATAGNGEPAVAAAWSGLALVLLERGKYLEAEGYLKRARACHERNAGADHRDAMHDACDLAWVYTQAGRLDEAGKWFKIAQAESETVLPRGHWHHGHLLGRYGFFLARQGSTAEAAIAFSHALRLLRKQLGEGHFRTRWVSDQLAALEARK